MSTRRIFNKFNVKMKLSTVTNLVLIVSSLFAPHCRCESVDDEFPSDPAAFLKTFARKGREAVDKYKNDGINGLLSENTVEAASKQMNDLFQSSAPAQLGYGFLMGYASGFCIKKVTFFLVYFAPFDFLWRGKLGIQGCCFYTGWSVCGCASTFV